MIGNEKLNLGHVMIDLETLGTKSNSVVTSIAAVEFNLKTGEIGRQFHQNISIKSSVDAGLEINPDTIEWWMNQSDEARTGLFNNVKTLKETLYLFRLFLNDIGQENLSVWGNSNRFDLGLLENAYSKFNQVVPWKYTLERDVRTLVSFNPDIKKNEVRTGTAHDPISDCLFQIIYCTKIYNTISIKL